VLVLRLDRVQDVQVFNEVLNRDFLLEVGQKAEELALQGLFSDLPEKGP
jgi:hypothetical protein